MPQMYFIRPLVAGAFAAVLVTAAGCPSPSTPKQPPADEPIGVTVEPVGAKPVGVAVQLPPQQMVQLPPQQPDDLAVQTPIGPPVAADMKPPLHHSPLPRAPTEGWSGERQGVRESGIQAGSEPPEPSNPLRDGSQPPAEDSAVEPPKEQAQPPVGRPRTGKNSGIPFDPIKENGPIFAGWPKPKLALVITGMEEGYLEPCGCAGLDRMKGGMARRATLFKQLRQDGWPVVGLDVGGLVKGFGRQAELKFQTLVESKRKMGYDAIAFGVDDLRLPAGELVAVAASVDGNPSPFVAANVGLFGFAAEIAPTSRVIEAGGMKVGITAVLGKKYQKEIHNDEIELSDPEAALEKIVPELKRKADYLVLLAHATLEETVALAKRFPAFNVVVASDGFAEPPAAPQTIEGTKTLLITVGHKGMNAIVLGLFDDADRRCRYQRVPLDSRFASSPDMKMLMAAYQEQLKAIGFAGLGLRPVPHPQLETNGKFIGSQKCESCHEKSYNIWKKSGHGRAYDTLVKLDPPRHFDPECVSCHVTGWHPTKFFPYETGYQSREKTPRLIDTGCETCHGPGEKHAAAEIGANEELQEKLRKAMVVTKAESKKQQCLSCHDIDNSPDFDFDKYWPFVEHYEKE